jgi:hypothetical protein
MATDFTEMRHLFDIARNLVAARHAAAQAADDIRFHLNEIFVMRTHTTNDSRVRDLCACIVPFPEMPDHVESDAIIEQDEPDIFE